LILLENEADSIPDLIKREFIKGSLVDVGNWVTMFMNEIKTDVLGIFDECLFLLNEEVSVLAHPFIDILLSSFFGWSTLLNC